jgi:hypothetical protein
MGKSPERQRGQHNHDCGSHHQQVMTGIATPTYEELVKGIGGHFVSPGEKGIDSRRAEPQIGRHEDGEHPAGRSGRRAGPPPEQPAQPSTEKNVKDLDVGRRADQHARGGRARRTPLSLVRN